jgi:hypothetical protein
MTGLNKVERVEVSEEMVDAGQQYLSKRGAVEEPSLLLYHGFVKHMLETTMDESGKPSTLITEAMQDRAIEYFSRYFDPEDPMIVTYRQFVRSLLVYALLGIDEHKVH